MPTIELAEGEIAMYLLAGKPRVHMDSCKRFKRRSPEEKAAAEVMTLKQATARGLEPCSRCPIPGSENNPILSPEVAAMKFFIIPGKAKGHIEGCRRGKRQINRLTEEQKPFLVETTVQEAQNQGVLPCSRCPLPK